MKLHELTAVGRYYRVYVDTTRVSQHTTEREAIERACAEKISSPNASVFYIHDYEVEVSLTNAGLTVAGTVGGQTDDPPVIISTPVIPNFIEGTPGSHDLTQYVLDDGISVVTYTLTNTLPNGLSLVAGILIYDGFGIPTVSQHQLTATDAVGSDQSALFNVTITANPVTGSWPVHWPQVSGQYNISARGNVLRDAGEWSARKDLTIFQGKYLDSGGSASTEIADELAILRASYGDDCVYGFYIIHVVGEVPSATVSGKFQQYEVIADNNAENEWFLHDPNGNVLYGSRDLEDDIYLNTSDVCPLVGGKNFHGAYSDRLHARMALGTDMTINTKMIFLDSTDPDNQFPQMKIGSSLGPDFNGIPDYNNNSVADDSQADYRNGIVEFSNMLRAKGFSVSCNGGRDGDYSHGTLTDFEWYQAFDCRIAENAEGGLGNWVSDSFIFEFNNASARMDDLFQKMAISYEQCRPELINALGRPYAMWDGRVANGFTGMTIDDFNQDQRDWASFWYAWCMMDERFMYGGLVFKGQPAPSPDEYFYDIGNPKVTRSMGVLDSVGGWTTKVPDDTTDGRWYFQEFDNGYFYINIPTLSSVAGVDWGTLSTTYATTAYPATPAGKVARRMNSLTYTHPDRGYGAFGYNTNKNDGSDPYVGGELIEKAWRGGLVVWADATYVPTLIKTLADSSGKAVADIFHPGHWYVANGEDELFGSFLNESKFVGAKMAYDWKDIETAEGVYDWTSIDARLAQCAGAGKMLTILIKKAKFGTGTPNTPSYMWNDASYGGDPTYYGNWPKTSQVGWRPFLENTKVQTSLNNLHAAIGTRYGAHANFESIHVGESSLDGPQGDALLEAGFKAVCISARDALSPHGKYTIVNINFADYWAANPGESSEETACNWAADNDMGLGGPDLKENNALLNSGLFKVCRERHLDVPTAVDVQFDNYNAPQNTDKTVREILAFGNGEVFGIVTAQRAADSPLNWIHAWDPRQPWYTGSPTDPVSGDNVVTVVATAPVTEAELFYESIGQEQYT
jgi:hypothetical protein